MSPGSVDNSNCGYPVSSIEFLFLNLLYFHAQDCTQCTKDFLGAFDCNVVVFIPLIPGYLSFRHSQSFGKFALRHSSCNANRDE